MKKILFLVSVLAVIVSGCKKDDDPSNTEKLTGKAWKIKSYTVDPAINIGGTLVTDVWAQQDACAKDGSTTFNADKSYIDDEGSTKCNVADPQTVTGIWSFNSDETVLTLDNTDNFNILQNDGNVLKMSFISDFGGISYTYTVTFNK